MNPIRTVALVSFICFAALIRLVPHPWNFTPLGAMALFGGAQFKSKKMAFIFPFSALIVSDLIIGFYPDIIFVYGSFALIVALGIFVRKHRSVNNIFLGAVAGSVLFFFITNFGVWAVAPFYEKSMAGLLQCYTAGLPYFRNTLISDVAYSAFLFGAFHLAERAVPVLRERPVQSS